VIRQRQAVAEPVPRHEIEQIIEDALAAAMDRIVMPRINAVVQEVNNLRREVEQLKTAFAVVEKLVSDMGAKWMYAGVTSAVKMLLEQFLPEIIKSIQASTIQGVSQELGKYIKEVSGSEESVSQIMEDLSSAIGNISRSVEEIRGSMKSLSAKVSELEKRMGRLEESLDSVVKEVRSSVTSLSAKIESMDARLRRLEEGEGEPSLTAAIKEFREGGEE